MARTGRLAALLVVLCVASSSCAASGPEPEPDGRTSTAAQTTTPSASASSSPRFDLRRIAAAESALPADFVLLPSVSSKVLSRLVDGISAVVSFGKPFVVEPRQCRPVLKPVEAVVGADTTRFRGDAPDKQSISVGAVEPVSVQTAIPTAGCDRMTFEVDDRSFTTKGVAERITAPAIDRATTIAVKVQVDGSPYTEFSYAAIIDESAYVEVQARLEPDSRAESSLPRLLVEAVAAIRSR